MPMFGPASPSLDTRQGMQRLLLGSEALVSKAMDVALLLRLLTLNCGQVHGLWILMSCDRVWHGPLRLCLPKIASLHCMARLTSAACHLPCL